MKNVEDFFNLFLSDIQLTQAQRDDAQTKYQGVINCLANHFYNRVRQDKDQFLFGSYKTKTNIRPLDNGSDVDVLFKIDQNIYNRYKSNPSGLLQEIRNALKDKYTSTDEIKAWGKVVLVKFSNGHHNVELLPALENSDNTFTIPNTENGGSWENFDPRVQVDAFYNSKNHELVRDTVQMTKSWIRNTSTMTYKSYKLMDDAIQFVDSYYPNGKCDNEYDEIMLDFLSVLQNRKNLFTLHLYTIGSYIDTAHSHAVKAIEYRKNGKYIEATQEWQKIFGNSFKLATENDTTKNQEARSFTEAARPWYLK